MQTNAGMHKRAAAAPLANGANDQASTVPLTKLQRRRRKRKRKPSQIVEDWMAVILGFVILVGLAYWIFTKLLWLGDSGAYDDDHQVKEEHNNHKRHHHKDGKSPMDRLKPVAFNELYHLPESHELVGDRSNKYARTRQQYDQLLPKNPTRSMNWLQQLKNHQAAGDYNVVPILASESHGSLHQHHRRRRIAEGIAQEQEEEEEKTEEELRKDQVYDIYDCPEEPVPGYPYAWPILNVLDNWSPDDTTIPDVIYQGLCVFDFQKDFKKAMRYRDLEVPFVIQNDPEVTRTVERWNYPGYMQDLLTGVKHRAEYSENNHFMYHLPPKPGKGKHGRGPGKVKVPPNYVPPTENIRMTYHEWLEKANVTGPAVKKDEKAETEEEGDDGDDDGQVAGPHKEHWYFRLIGCGLTGPDGSCDKGSSEYLYDELPFFQPVNNLYLREGAQQKGIHCRFGMKGVIAENHFDGSRNSIVLLGGARRYILAHPDQCEALSLFPNGHPSARHSQVDYTNPDLDSFPQFAKANANEVIMQPGDVLYLPTHWFHYIVSLELNFQCNTRSGLGNEYDEVIGDCGF